MIRQTFTIFILAFIWFQSGAQRTVTTLSGQKILLLNNKTWKKITPNEQNTDSLGMLVNEMNVLTLPPSHALSEQVINNISLLLAAAQNKEIENFIFLDSLDREIAIKEVNVSKSKISNNEVDIKELKSQIKELRNKFKVAEKVYQSSSENIKIIKNLPGLSASSQQNKIKEFASIYEVQLVQGDENQKIGVVSDKEDTANKNKNKKTNCNIIKDEKIDKERHIETEKEFLYSYTPDRLKNYFKEKELMEVSVSTQKVGKNHFVCFTVKIISKDAAKNYGLIQKGNMLKISFISGKSIILNALEDTRSSLESYTGHSIYNVTYPLVGEATDLLSKIPLDTIGIMWSSGFETYDIYEVDLLIKQLTCIKSI